MLRKLLIVLLVLSASVAAAPQRGGGGGGSGAPAMIAEPTPFEVFVDKMKLSGDQIDAVAKILQTGAGKAAPVAQEMIQLRQKLLVAETAGKADDVTAALTAYSTAAAKMAAQEIATFTEIQGVLKGGQLNKSGEGLTMIAGMFHPPAPRAGGSQRRGGGQ
jgi:hypothetical protein